MRVLCINCKPDLSYFTKRGLNLDVEYKTINEVFPLQFLYNVKNQNNVMVPTYTPSVGSYLENNYKESDYTFIMVGWKPSEYSDVMKNTGGYSSPFPLSNGTRWMTVRQDPIPNNIYPIHELHHAICAIINVDLGHHIPVDFMDQTLVNGIWQPYYLNDQPENPQSNYAVTWNAIKPFLSKLNSYTKSPMYKYFKPNEIVGLKPELVKLLDDARHIAGIPFKINSGKRTVEQNKKAGGVEDSAHLVGLGCDISCTSDANRWKIVTALQKVGFNRIGISKNFVHCDIDKSKSSNVIWLYD
jgi:zinc D-Ala-D-Ala carboxypeptidase